MNLLDVLGILMRRRKFILLDVLCFTILAAAVSLVLPHRYAATARVLPPPADDPLGLTAQLSAGISGRLGRLPAGMLGGGTESDLMVGILSSSTVMESVAVRCSVATRCRIRGGSSQEAVRALGRMSRFSVGDEGIVSVTVEARRPNWAADIANRFVEQLDLFLRNSNMSRGKNMRIFVEGRLSELCSQLDSARTAMTEFQVENGLVAPDEQMKGVVSSFAELYAALLVKQASVRVYENRTSQNNPLRGQLRTDIATYRRQLSDLLSDRGERSSRGLFGLPLESLPAISSGYARRYADLALLEEMYAMSYQQLEQARLMEARDTPTITVLDYAVPPERRSFPRRALIVLIAFLFSLVVSSSYVLAEHVLNQLPVTHPGAASSWLRLRDQLTQVSGQLFKPFRRRSTRDG